MIEKIDEPIEYAGWALVSSQYGVMAGQVYSELWHGCFPMLSIRAVPLREGDPEQVHLIPLQNAMIAPCTEEVARQQAFNMGQQMEIVRQQNAMKKANILGAIPGLKGN